MQDVKANTKIQKTNKEIQEDNKSSKRFVRDYLALRNAIIENCRDCIRDCGRDCLDFDARPIENIRCPLQKVRIDYGIIIKAENHDVSRWKVIRKQGFEIK
ncbi:MAG: hypothetical protein JSW00_04880 [Thermoplasmata archaeon]|nr:MAG: hypothetical protein JSW00_04880 [Thermoplasmata archaeon]